MGLLYNLSLSPLPFLFPPPYFSFHFPFLPSLLSSLPFHLLLLSSYYPLLQASLISLIHSSFLFYLPHFSLFFLVLFHALHFIHISVLTFTVVHLESGRVKILWFAAFAVILEGIILIALMTLHV